MKKNKGWLFDIGWVVPLPRMPVTTRNMTFLGSGIPINLHLPLLLGGGTTQDIGDYTTQFYGDYNRP